MNHGCQLSPNTYRSSIYITTENGIATDTCNKNARNRNKLKFSIQLISILPWHVSTAFHIQCSISIANVEQAIQDEAIELDLFGERKIDIKIQIRRRHVIFSIMKKIIRTHFLEARETQRQSICVLMVSILKTATFPALFIYLSVPGPHTSQLTTRTRLVDRRRHQYSRTKTESLSRRTVHLPIPCQ